MKNKKLKYLCDMGVIEQSWKRSGSKYVVVKSPLMARVKIFVGSLIEHFGNTFSGFGKRIADIGIMMCAKTREKYEAYLRKQAGPILGKSWSRLPEHMKQDDIISMQVKCGCEAQTGCFRRKDCSGEEHQDDK